MPNAYANLTQLKSAGWLNITATTYDSDLLRILQDAAFWCDDFTHRHFYCWEGTQYFDGAGITFIPNEDILSITTISLDQDGSQGYSTTLGVTDYFKYPLGGPFIWPKTMLKMSHISGIGYFASGIRAGIKIIGVFGYGDGQRQTPYDASGAVVNTGGITDSATTHTLATGKGALLAIGQTIRIGSEQLYITGIAVDTLTFMRGQNGTTAAAHTAADIIYIYTYPGPVIEANLIQATRWWKRRETAFQTAVQSEAGTYNVYKGLDPDVQLMLAKYVKRALI